MRDPIAIPNLIQAFWDAPVPEKVWHYTSLQGFLGIVTSKSIFLTDIRFLNDREEFVHARKMALEMVERTPEVDESGFGNREFFELAVNAGFDYEDKFGPRQVFVASFSAAEDQLSQWRGYSHGTSGVSVAFDLRPTVRPDLGRGLPGVVRCVYEPAEKENLLSEAFQGFRDELRGQQERIFDLACELDPSKRGRPDKRRVVAEFLKANPDEQFRGEAFRRAASGAHLNCAILSGVLKDSSFREEKEWRMVHTFASKAPQEFRVGRGTLVPYKRFEWARVGVSIVDVILGPGSDENALLAAGGFLEQEGIKVQPRLSSVPYHER